MLTVSTDEGHIYAFHHEHPVTHRMSGQSPMWHPFPQDGLTDFYQSAAKEILDRSGHKSGYCLVLGSEQGRLAYELAQQSELTVIGVEPDAAKAAESRQALERAGVHATRVTIVNAPLDQLPFSNYFATLIVSDSLLLGGKLPCDPEQIARHLKPCGGVAILGRPADAPAVDDPVTDQAMTEWLTELYHREEGEVIAAAPWFMLRRGKLAGAGAWSHQYGNVGNTSYTDDQRIRDGLGVLWYGDPGPERDDQPSRSCRCAAIDQRADVHPGHRFRDGIRRLQRNVPCGNTTTPVRFAPVCSTTARRTTWRPAMTRCMSRSATPARRWTPAAAKSWRSTRRPSHPMVSSGLGPTWLTTTGSCLEPARFAKNSNSECADAV